MTDTQWIQERLPDGANFSKNGVTMTIEAAIADALAANANNKRLALADLLEILAADIPFQTQTVEGETYSGEQLSARAKNLRDEVAAEATPGDGSAGSFSFVPIRRPAAASDEYSQ